MAHTELNMFDRVRLSLLTSGTSSHIVSRSITIVCLSCVVLLGCWADPDVFTRHIGDRMFFVIGDSVSRDYTCDLDSPSFRLNLKGLYTLVHTDQGLVHAIHLRVECKHVTNVTGLAFDPSAITASVRGVVLSVRNSRTLTKGQDAGVVAYDINMQDRKCHTTLSVVGDSPEFYEPAISIDLSHFVMFGDSTVPIGPIVAYARDPSLKK